MQIIELTKGQYLHKKGSTVSTIDIISKGELRVSGENLEFRLGGSEIVALMEAAGGERRFDYQCETDSCVVCSYPYSDLSDLTAIIKANPKIAPLLCSGIIKTIHSVDDALNAAYEEIAAAYDSVKSDQADYPTLCAFTGSNQMTFTELITLTPCPRPNPLPGWTIPAIKGLFEHDSYFRKNLYSISADIDTGIICSLSYILKDLKEAAIELSSYKKDFDEKTREFRNTINIIRAKAESITNNTGDDDSVPEFKNVAETLMSYAGLDAETADMFLVALNNYKHMTTRDSYSDEYRHVKNSLTPLFYKLYSKVFFKTLTDDNIPEVVMMFLLFGYSDEDLLSRPMTENLYRTMKSIIPDKSGKVMTLYDWLKKIYYMEIEPSRNEFNLDYAGYLKEQKSQGVIDEDEVKRLFDDPANRVLFEINNFFMVENRVTYGQASSFIPLMKDEDMIKSPAECIMNASAIYGELDKIRHDDFSLFYREVMYSNPKAGLNTYFYNEEVLPYFVLLPNCGSKLSLWQEIEGKKRNTPARFAISLFHTADLYDNLLRACGEYRWEMCKTIQGVHWNDVTDPSLTAEYCDYLQFYKKNRMLSSEQKEKIYQELKKYSNRYNTVFIANYMSYMKFERVGSLRLNKPARSIIFSYCPFSKDLRQRLASSPQYGELLKAYDIKKSAELHTLANLMAKVEKTGAEMPQELIKQKKFLEM
ncbi:hypothetical protein [Butyrivibrio sp. MC2013]|uniref:hypothetical protein n=1 Tax=Butyrivibrio sp. MC2013 TaxID=1280686 RepID=UPI0004164424|nr:hypothetical protein [Butyrivibrio sp. MC2013]